MSAAANLSSNVGASQHAYERMLARVGVDLPHSTWVTIVDNARAGLYVEVLAHRAPPDGATKTFAVPMGTSERDMFIVPMVIHLDKGMVVTVLDPEPP